MMTEAAGLRALLLDEAIRGQIAKAVAAARGEAITAEQAQALAVPRERERQLGGTILVDLKAREGLPERPRPSHGVVIPFGYTAAISFEEQPIGLCAHLSISVDAPRSLPSYEATTAIARAFGLSLDDQHMRLGWVEEYAPQRHAVNIVERIEAGRITVQ